MDQKVKPLATYQKEMNEEYGLMTSSVRTDTSFRIEESKLEDDKGSVTVTIRYPDYSSVIEELFFHTLENSLSGKDNKEMKEDATKLLQDKDVPLKEEPVTYNVVKEEGEWKVFLNWEQERLIKLLKEQGKELEEKEKYSDALDKYNKIFSITNDKDTALKVSELTDKITEIEQKQEYIDKYVVVYDVVSDLYNSYSDSLKPGVSFKIQNKGDKDLTKVCVTVYFTDKNGIVIAEEDYCPIYSNSYITDSSVLKANHIWSLPSYSFYPANVPSEWKVGSAIAKVTDIEF